MHARSIRGPGGGIELKGRKFNIFKTFFTVPIDGLILKNIQKDNKLWH